MSTIGSIVVAGLAVGTLYGLFGVGSAFATPLLSVLGIPGMAAVVGPLPGLLPGAATGAWSYARDGKVDWWVAKRTICGALPATIAGAILSHWVGGPILLVASGVMLLSVGIRVLRDDSSARTDRPVWAHDHAAALVAASVVVGFASGLLANGGGFLLVPLFLLVVGLDMNHATGTSLVVAAAMTVPTLATHAVIGDINWAVALTFGAGLVPGVRIGAVAAQRISSQRLRRSFGFLLVGFAVWFLLRLWLS